MSASDPKPDPAAEEGILLPPSAALPIEAATFRWQAFFQRSSEPLFFLNRNRRLLFVNRAWEDLTGLTLGEVRGRACRRRAKPEPGSWEELARAQAPPPEVLAGQIARVRRQAAVGQWWDVEFFPLRDASGLLGILGKVSPHVEPASTAAAALPEELTALRQRAAQRYTLDALASAVPRLQRVVEQVRLAARTRVPVLVVGEPGSGKRWLARIIHHTGVTSEQGFAALDCAHLPPATLAEALFGAGVLPPRAALGTLYLREPAGLPRDLQARLHEWLGQAQAGEADAGPRLIAGCSIDPAAEVKSGRLLDELHCTLGTLVIALPPLRERLADLPVLIDRVLERVNPLRERRLVGLTPSAWEYLRSYSWPGNLRELNVVVTTAADHARGSHIDAGDLPTHVRQVVSMDRLPPPPPPKPLALDQVLEEVERRLIVLALRRAGGNKSRAAELLSIWRQRLIRRMETLGILE